MRTIFKPESFSKDSNDLYLKAVSEKKTSNNLAVFANYDWLSESHSRGVAQIVAEYVSSGIIDIKPDQQETLVRIAALHDIGKLSWKNVY